MLSNRAVVDDQVAVGTLLYYILLFNEFEISVKVTIESHRTNKWTKKRASEKRSEKRDKRHWECNWSKRRMLLNLNWNLRNFSKIEHNGNECIYVWSKLKTHYGMRFFFVSFACWDGCCCSWPSFAKYECLQCNSFCILYILYAQRRSHNDGEKCVA